MSKNFKNHACIMFGLGIVSDGLFCVLTYYVLRSKSNGLFARITMGFIVNLILALSMFMSEHLKDEKIHTPSKGCKAKGYFTQYFFLVRNVFKITL